MIELTILTLDFFCVAWLIMVKEGVYVFYFENFGLMFHCKRFIYYVCLVIRLDHGCRINKKY